MTHTHREYIKRAVILDLLHALLLITTLLIVYLFFVSSKYLVTAGSVLVFLILMRITFGFLEEIQKKTIYAQKRNKKTWGEGDAAESKMSEYLSELPPEYKIINDIQTGNGNIDHLVIGPTGIFVVETKSHHGTVGFHNNNLYINTKKLGLDYVDQAYAEKAWLTDKLLSVSGKKYPITPILSFPFAQVDAKSISGPIKGVLVAHGYFANELIKHHQDFLNYQEIKRVTSLLYTITKA